MNRVIEFLYRHRLADTPASMARIVLWAVVWLALVGLVPLRGSYADRHTPPDVPPTAVRYVAPLDMTDVAGFLPPRHDPKAFTIAWIGGSESKLEGVSVPGEVSRRIATVGARPVLIDSYNLLAPRTLDAYLALRAAIRSNADAIVLAVNPVWFTPQWSIHDWPNLDAADPTAFARHPVTLPWLAASVTPADMSWATLLATIPALRQQERVNIKLSGQVDKLSVLKQPATPQPAALPPAPFRPFENDFWLAQYLGGRMPDQSIQRLRLLLRGMDGIADRAIGERYVRLLLSEAAASGKPTFVYTNPLSFDALNDPDLGPLAARVEGRLAALASQTSSATVVVQSRYITRDMTPIPDLFMDVAHMRNAGPVADVLTRKLCDALALIRPALVCA